MSDRREGWLILADIGGYTKFLSGTELEHAHDILQDLLRRHDARRSRGAHPARGHVPRVPAHGPMPAIQITEVFEPLDDGQRTRVQFLVRVTGTSWWDRLRVWLVRMVFPGALRKDAAKLAGILTGSQAG